MPDGGYPFSEAEKAQRFIRARDMQTLMNIGRDPALEPFAAEAPPGSGNPFASFGLEFLESKLPGFPGRQVDDFSYTYNPDDPRHPEERREAYRQLDDISAARLALGNPRIFADPVAAGMASSFRGLEGQRVDPARNKAESEEQTFYPGGLGPEGAAQPPIGIAYGDRLHKEKAAELRDAGYATTKPRENTLSASLDVEEFYRPNPNIPGGAEYESVRGGEQGAASRTDRLIQAGFRKIPPGLQGSFEDVTGIGPRTDSAADRWMEQGVEITGYIASTRSLLGDLDDMTGAEIGPYGDAARSALKWYGALPGVTAENVEVAANALTGTSTEKLQAFKTFAQMELGKTMAEVTGDPSRFSDKDVEMAREAVNLLEKATTIDGVRAALQVAQMSRIMRLSTYEHLLGYEPRYDLSHSNPDQAAREAQNMADDLIEDAGLTEEYADRLVGDILTQRSLIEAFLSRRRERRGPSKY